MVGWSQAIIKHPPSCLSLLTLRRIKRAKVRKICWSRQKQFTKWRKSGGGQGKGDISTASDTKTVVCSVQKADWCTATQQASYFGKNITQLLLLGTVSYGMKYPFVQLSQLCLNLLPTFSLLTVRAEWETEKAWILCESCSPIKLVCCQHWFSHKFKTQHHTGCYEES